MKNIFHNLILLILLIIVINCQNNNNDKHFKNYTNFKKFNKINHKSIKHFSNDKFYMFQTPVKLIDDKYLVIANDNNSNDEMVLIYDIDTGKKIKSFGKKGKGPGEFIYCHKMINDRNKNLLIYDYNQKRMSYFNIKDLVRNKKIEPDSIKKIDLKEGDPLKFCYLNKNTIVSTGIFFKNRITYFNRNLDVVKKVGAIPGNITDKTKKFQYIQTTNIVSSDGKFTFGYKKDDILVIYNDEGSVYKTIQGPDNNTLSWEEGKSFIGRKMGYSCLDCSEKNIYAVYSGDKILKKNEFIKEFGKSILIYDWNGTPIKKILTDVRIVDIAISEKKGKIFATYFDGEFFRIGYFTL